MSYSSSRMPGASISRKTAGCGPCRSGWTMKVSIVPVRVAMSRISSIMAVCLPWPPLREWSHGRGDGASASAPGRADEPQTQEPGGRVDDRDGDQDQQDHVGDLVPNVDLDSFRQPQADAAGA